MKAYWISVYKEVENQENLKKYAEVVTPIIKSFGGIPLVRGGKHITYDGDDFPVSYTHLTLPTIYSV